MATLSNPNLRIDALTGIPYQSRVTATVNVELTPLDMELINSGFPVHLYSSVWGDDSKLDADNFYGDDFLFSFTPSTPQSITASGTYSFSKIVPNATLNEDNFSRDNIIDRIKNIDEIYNRFTMTSTSYGTYSLGWGRGSIPRFTGTVTSINTPVVLGIF